MIQKRLLALTISILMILLAIAPALAAETDDQQRQLEEIQRQMQVQQNRAADAQRQVNSLSEQLRVIQDDLDSAIGDYNTIQNKKTHTEQQIKANGEILAKAEKSLAERSVVLNKRVRDIYKNGQISYLDVLLGAADFSDFTTRVDLLQRVIRQDIALITKVKAERELVLQKKAELERDRQLMLEFEKAAAEKKNIVESRKNAKETVLYSAVSERDSAEQAYQELQETSRRIERMIRGHGSGNRESAGSTGVLIWPAEGPYYLAIWLAYPPDIRHAAFP